MWAKFALYFQTNKQMKQYFLAKTNFFQLRKIFTREYIKHTPGTPGTPGTRRKCYFYSCFHYSTHHTYKQQREKRWDLIFQKIKGGAVAPFPVPFSFFFLFLLQRQTLPAYYLPIYISFICVSFVTLTNTACFYSVLLLCFVSSFQCFVWLPICFRSVSLSLSLSPSTDPPHPHFTVQNRWLPHSLIFYFFGFQKFFVEKMRYDLFTFCMCLCRH